MFSTTTKYAVKALVHLARAPAGASILGRELAQRTCIPLHYLSKIMLVLRNAGLVDTTRGLGGGYRLSKPANQILLEEATKLFEAGSNEPGCLLAERPKCSDRAPCSAHRAWKGLRRAYIDFLGSTTIEDIAGPRRPAARDRLQATSKS